MTDWLVRIAGFSFRFPLLVLLLWTAFLGTTGVSLWLSPLVPKLRVESYLPDSQLDWENEVPRETLIYRGPKDATAPWPSEPEVEQVWGTDTLPQEVRETFTLKNGDHLTWLQLTPGLRTIGESRKLMERLAAPAGGQFIGHSPTRIALHDGIWQEIYRIGVPSLLLFLVLPWIFFRNIGVLLAPLCVGVPCALGVLALYGLFGDHFSYFSFTLIPVLLCLCTLDTVFLLSRLVGPVGAEVVEEAVDALARPCLLTSVTTGLGMGCLSLLSEVPVVGEYGLFGLAGVTLALPLVFSVVPALYRLGAFKGKPRPILAFRHSRLLPPLVIGGTLLLSLGLRQFLEGGQGVHFFSASHPYQKSLTELEEHFGSLFPIRFEVEGDSKPGRLFLYARGLESWLQREGLVKTTLAPWTGRPFEKPTGKVDWAEVARVSQGWVRVEGNRPVSVSFLAWPSATSTSDYRKFDRYLTNFERTMMAEFTVKKRGAFFVIKGMEQRFIREMWKAFALSVFLGLLVVGVAALGWRNLPGFALVNILPVVGTLGLLGWLGLGAEASLLALPCLLFGIVVDDSIHLYCAHVRLGSWQAALEENLLPLTFTSLLLGGTFLIQLNSYYAPNQAFGLGGAIGVALAYGWDRWVLPALVSQDRKKESSGDVLSTNELN